MVFFGDKILNVNENKKSSGRSFSLRLKICISKKNPKLIPLYISFSLNIFLSIQESKYFQHWKVKKIETLKSITFFDKIEYVYILENFFIHDFKHFHDLLSISYCLFTFEKGGRKGGSGLSYRLCISSSKTDPIFLEK